MLDCLKEIIVALIEQKQIANTGDTDTNIQEVNKAINEIGKKLYSVSSAKFE